MFQFISGSFLFVIVIAVFFLMSAIKILNEYEQAKKYFNEIKDEYLKKTQKWEFLK